MRIGVVGAGAVGATLAAVLHRAGHEVAVTARSDALAVIARDGIVLTGAWGEHIAPVPCSPSLGGSFDLVVYATKAPDLAAAVEANRGVSSTGVLVVRNGLDARGEVGRLLGDATPVFGGLAVFAASLTAPGRVTVTAGAPLYLSGPGADDLAEALREALPVVAVEDAEGAEWTKLVVNQVNALPAITGLSVQQTIADRRLRRVLTRSIRETLDVARAGGVRFAKLQGLSDPLLRLVRAVPEWVAEGLPMAMARRMGSVPNPGSTLQSLRRGRPTEVDWLNGAVVDAARRWGRDAPINAALVAMVHEVESRGEFLSVDEILARVPRSLPA